MSKIPIRLKRPFVDRLREVLVAKKSLTHSSVELYFKNLKILNQSETPSNLDFLQHTSHIGPLIDQYNSVHTRKTLFATACTMIQVYRDNPFESNYTSSQWSELYDWYRDRLVESDQQLDNLPKNTKNHKQSENWITWDQVLGVYQDLCHRVESLKDKRPPLNSSDFDLLNEFMVLSLYVLTPTKRNVEYYLMDYISPTNDSLDQDLPLNRNYYLPTRKQFIINQHKNAKTSGTIVTDVKHQLAQVIQFYIKYHPCNQEQIFPLLVRYGGRSLANNSITRILNRIFGGKHIGSNMLRHIWKTSKYGAFFQEMTQDAINSGHSVQRQLDYIVFDTPNK